MIKPAAVAIAAVLLFAPVLGIELGVRVLIAADRLPDAPSSSDEADVSLANLERLGKPDILVLGTSSIRNALQPDVLEALVAEEIGRDVHVQTVAQAAISLEGQRLLVKGLAERDLLPELIVLGMTPSTMTGYGPDGDWFVTSELGRLWSGCADLSEPEASGCRIRQESAVQRWRGRVDALLMAAAEGMPHTIGDDDRRLTESGWLSESAADTEWLKGRLPSAVAQLPKGVPLPPSNKRAFAALIEEMRSHGAEVVAVALPYAPILEQALIERNPAWRQKRDAGYAKLGQAADLDVIVVQEYGDWWTLGKHNDLRHLSRLGSGPLTVQLWSIPEFREPLLEGLTSAD